LWRFGLAVLLALLVMTPGHAWAQDSAPDAYVLNIDGSITQVMDDYLERGLRLAEDRGAEVVVVLIDTPGGSIDVMNSMIMKMRGSSVPVVTYVAPRNAWAGSAGTLITLAGEVAAMAPETSIGAASPVGSAGEDIGETMEEKVKNILKATARSLTQGRPEEAVRLAEETIETAQAVTVDEALEVGLIDIKAFDVEDLLEQIDGRTVMVGNEDVTLNTAGANVVVVEHTLIEQVLATLIDPNLVFLLLAIGVQSLLIELSSPGGWVAGFIGAVCLVLAVYGLGVLPVNWFGILFMIIAFVLFLLEIKTPTLGVLTVAGAISFIVGALVLFNSVEMPGAPTVSVPLVVGTGIVLAASFLAIVTFAIRAQRTPVQTGSEALPGRIGIARTELNPRGTVYVAGELWQAEIPEGEAPISAGVSVEVVEVVGLTVRVKQKGLVGQVENGTSIPT
jgi:membrane-bound serine protease (ClpP class)